MREIIRAGRGKLFDPEVVDAFEELCETGEIFEPVTSTEVDRRVSEDEAKHPC